MFRLRDRKVKQFAKTVSEKQNSIFVFGSNVLTGEFIYDLIEIGLGNKVALISDEEREWIEDVKEKITVLIEKKHEKYQEHQLYDLIGFSTAEKIIILHDNELVQYIINNIEDISHSDVKIIMVSQFAPPFLKYLSQAQKDKFVITDNVHSITAELYNLMGLALTQPPIITVPVPAKLVGRKFDELGVKKSKILRVQRTIDGKAVNLPPENPFKEQDLVMVYLFEGEDSIREIIGVFE